MNLQSTTKSPIAEAIELSQTGTFLDLDLVVHELIESPNGIASNPNHM